MESLDDSKAGMLSRSTRYDRCCYMRGDGDSFVYNAKAPNGRCVRLFRTLFTNECFHQCGYCPNAGRLSGGCSYTSEELVNFTLKLKDAGLIDGLFLSSGAGKDVDLTMEGMLSSVRLLREKHGFSGYIHLKIIPGTSRDLIKEAVRLADRVSLNIEAPSRDIMEELSSTKDYENDILKVQKYIRDISMRANQTTQMVVGAADESDMEIFKRAVMEYDEIGVKRVYYSAFVPRKGTRFEKRPLR